MQQTAVIYTRVSTEEQAKEGASLEAQERLCKEYCIRQNWIILKVFREDGVSGGKIDRPALQKLLDYVSKNKGKVNFCLVHKIDRFARDLSIHAQIKGRLIKYGVELKSVTEDINNTPTGKAMEGMLAVFSEYYRNNLSCEVSKGQRERVLQGYWPFPAPIGYLNGFRDSFNGPIKKLKKPDCEYIKKALEDFAIGILQTPADFRRYLNETIKKYKWRKTPIAKQQSFNILYNIFYAGYACLPSLGILQKGKSESMISLETFQKVQDRLKENSRKKYKRMPVNETFPLKEKCYCLDCGYKITGAYATGRSAKYPFYRCDRGCKLGKRTKSISKDDFEEMFVIYVEKVKPQKRYIKLFNAVILDYYNKKINEKKNNVKEAEFKVNTLKERQEQLIDLITEAKQKG
ncbi:hypothetical protein A2476_02835, partial [candidate division CPR3 bacterium RIFOXYC2_FULL_35_7]